MRRRRKPSAHDIAAEIIRRGTTDDGSGQTAYVIRMAEPPTVQERLQLLAAHLQRRPIVIMPHKSATFGEWTERYGWIKDR